jgi:ferredoxin/flavodoxin---NADP+ reductase
MLSPVELIGDDDGTVRRIRLERNLLREDAQGNVRAEGCGEYEELETDWVFVSIGYQGRRLDDLPFDGKRGTIANEMGRVCDPATRATRPNEYVVGWAKSGPRGLIGTHRPASAAVVALMLKDLAEGSVPAGEDPGADAVVEFLNRKGVRFVSFDEWLTLDDREIERGRERGAPRRKFSDVGEMLDVVERER